MARPTLQLHPRKEPVTAHPAATLLLLQGVDIRTVMAIMGWTEMATAQRYLHAVDDLRRRAAQQMGSLLWDTCSTIP